MIFFLVVILRHKTSENEPTVLSECSGNGLLMPSQDSSVDRSVVGSELVSCWIVRSLRKNVLYYYGLCDTHNGKSTGLAAVDSCCAVHI